MSAVSLPPIPSCVDVEYRPIPGTIGYLIGTDGSVLSCRRTGGGFHQRWKRMRLCQHTGKRTLPYLRFAVQANDKKRSLYVHVVVMRAFIGPPPPGMEVRHIDGDVGNNRLDNLKYGTPTQNAADKLIHGTDQRGEKSARTWLKTKDVLEIRRRAAAGEKKKEIASDYGLSWTGVYHIINRKRWWYV